MNIRNLFCSSLDEYVIRQLSHIYPDAQKGMEKIIKQYLDESLDRTLYCINAIKVWKQNEFDVLHTSQYCTFLYFLANTIWRKEKDDVVCTQLFGLNKTLNGIDCFYEIEMPDIFFIGHSQGIVLSKARYSNYLVLYQHVTVGKNHGLAPNLGEEVILYPHSVVIGDCSIARGSVIAQGVSVISQDTKPDNYVFPGDNSRKLVFKPCYKNIMQDFFRDKN